MRSNVSNWLDAPNLSRTIFSKKQFLIALVLVIIAGIFQGTSLFDIGGIKPNFIIAVLITLSFFIADWFAYLSLVLVAVFFLRFHPGPESIDFILTALALAVFGLGKLIPGKTIFSIIFLIAIATPTLYFIGDLDFFQSNFLTVFQEMFYNIILGLFILFIGEHFLVIKK